MEVLERDELIFGPFIVIGEPPLRGLLTGLADGDMSLPPCSEMNKHMNESVLESDELILGPFIAIGEPPLRGLLTGQAIKTFNTFITRRKKNQKFFAADVVCCIFWLTQ